VHHTQQRRSTVVTRLSPQGLRPSRPRWGRSPQRPPRFTTVRFSPFSATVLGLRGIHADGADPPLRPPRAVAFCPCAAPRFTRERGSFHTDSEETDNV
jgi:hypothetical protein